MLAKVLRDTIRTGPFESYADLMDAWKTALVKARINWTNDELTEARTMVESNTELLAAPESQGHRTETAGHPDAPAFTPAEAAGMVARLREALHREAANGRHAAVTLDVKPIPAPPAPDVDVNAFRRKAGLWAR